MALPPPSPIPTDKSEGGKFSAEFEEASQKLQDFCECLGIEVNERINIVDMLEECKAFMTRQLSELQLTAKVRECVCNHLVSRLPSSGATGLAPG